MGLVADFRDLHSTDGKTKYYGPSWCIVAEQSGSILLFGYGRRRDVDIAIHVLNGTGID